MASHSGRLGGLAILLLNGPFSRLWLSDPSRIPPPDGLFGRRGLLQVLKRGAGVMGRFTKGAVHLSSSVLVIAALSGCDRGVLDPAGPIGAAERKILFDAVAIMLAIVVPVIIATLAIAYRFRASNARAPFWPTFTYSGRIELITWSIPVLVIFFLGGVAWTSSFLLDPARPLASREKPLEIQVVSLDWKWLFIYPEQHIASINRLVVPAGVPLHLRLTSASVWNVFWVPQLGSMLYCMHGMAGTLYLQADHPGVYQGSSAMISGDGFADMHFDTDALADRDFASWTTITS
jgi:cytochrome o ubiquinol oxidase subunit II